MPSAASARRSRQLGYVRNDAARQLRVGRSSTIGLVVLDVRNPFFTDLARGAESEAARHGLVGHPRQQRRGRRARGRLPRPVRGAARARHPDLALPRGRPAAAPAARARDPGGARRPPQRGRAVQLGERRRRTGRLARRRSPDPHGPAPHPVHRRAVRHPADRRSASAEPGAPSTAPRRLVRDRADARRERRRRARDGRGDRRPPRRRDGPDAVFAANDLLAIGRAAGSRASRHPRARGDRDHRLRRHRLRRRPPSCRCPRSASRASSWARRRCASCSPRSTTPTRRPSRWCSSRSSSCAPRRRRRVALARWPTPRWREPMPSSDTASHEKAPARANGGFAGHRRGRVAHWLGARHRDGPYRRRNGRSCTTRAEAALERRTRAVRDRRLSAHAGAGWRSSSASRRRIRVGRRPR